MATVISFHFSSFSNSILLILALACAPSLVPSSTLESDIQALRELKQSIDPISIHPNSYLHSWQFSMDPCESTGGFLGILCSFPVDNSSKRILSIYLDAALYDGFLTPSIGNLTELAELSLSENLFRGPIPDSIANIKKLTRLSLSDNCFTGGIPSGVTGLKRLEIMDLSRNRLSGSVPANISGMRRLIRLKLSHNSFAGRLPDLSGLWQINTLDLSNNQFYGYLPQLPPNLRTLDVSHNAISGHISPLRTLQRLTTIDVSDNRFTGLISEGVLTLPLVVQINASANRFTSIEPIKYPERDQHLQLLDAHANQLRGHLPVALAAVESLTSVDLSHNRLSGLIPEEYGKKQGQSWKSLFLQDNFLAGNLPPQFTSGKAGFRGSVAKNCLRCPPQIPLCSGGQRPSSECNRHENGSS